MILPAPRRDAPESSAQRCRLCGSALPLCLSHIVPEFLYQPLYDGRHRFHVVERDRQGSAFKQKGLRERLLCQQCEQRFSVYEKYAAEAMTGRLGHRYRLSNGRIVIGNIEYARFKLFQLSVLWRGSVSSLEFFKLVHLGPLETRLRAMLLEENPGEPHEFGCAVVFARDGGEDVSDTMFNPEPLRWCGRRMVKFFFAGSAWLFHCDRRIAPDYLQRLFLQTDGTLCGLAADLTDAAPYGPSIRRIARRLKL